MKKTFQLRVEGKHPDRVLDAVKHEIRKDIKRQRRRDLPAGVDYWDFDCRFGLTLETARTVHLNSLIALVDEVARDGGASFYVEMIAKPGHRKPSAPGQPDLGTVPAANDE